jgi:hypothetical protein
VSLCIREPFFLRTALVTLIIIYNYYYVTEIWDSYVILSNNDELFKPFTAGPQLKYSMAVAFSWQFFTMLSQ